MMLHKARESYGEGLSKVELAKLIGVSPKTIASWESGRTFIHDLELIPRLLDTIDFDVIQALKEAAFGPGLKELKKKGVV